MDTKTDQELSVLIERATAGDKQALEAVLAEVQDLVFNLSLRMLGTFPDAEDAAQDILLKVMTHLSSFRGDSAFSTWVFRIAVNHLKDYKKHMFAHAPLSFEFYGEDIKHGKLEDIPDLTQNTDQAILAEELKLSCTNVMLQCLDPESRCIFILGTMFRLDSRIAGDILNMTPEAYRSGCPVRARKWRSFYPSTAVNTATGPAAAPSGSIMPSKTTAFLPTALPSLPQSPTIPFAASRGQWRRSTTIPGNLPFAGLTDLPNGWRRRSTTF